jgi:cytochrome P450
VVRTSGKATLPKATLREGFGVAGGIFAPTLAKGVIIRRPAIMGMAETLNLDQRAVEQMQKLRDKYAPGPLMLRIPGRHQAVILDPDHVLRVLNESPEPFATASDEKWAALAHFEPKGALISHGAERAERRRFNVEALDGDSAVHRMGETFLPIVNEEARLLLDQARRIGEFRWHEFIDAWFNIIRRVIFGNGARDDRELTDLMVKLRSRANWAFLTPAAKDDRDILHGKIRGHLARAEAGSLAEHMAKIPRTGRMAPENQIPQWLFASDPAAMATFRALALLAAHPDQAERARTESDGGNAAARPYRPFLRACVCESLRLWPTTPMILRQTTRETTWEIGTMPAHTGILIFTPFFHRDDARLPYAHRFSPDVWMKDGREVDGGPPGDWPLVPFSSGPGVCPGRNVVLLLTSAMLAALLGGRRIRLKDPGRLDPGEPMPGTLDNYSLHFVLDG